jgi:hypothetical protein
MSPVRKVNLYPRTTGFFGPLQTFRLCSRSLPADLCLDAVASYLEGCICDLCGTWSRQNLSRQSEPAQNMVVESPGTHLPAPGSAWLLFHYIPVSCSQRPTTNEGPSEHSTGEPSEPQARIDEAMNWPVSEGLESQKRSIAEPRLWSMLDIMKHYKLRDLATMIDDLRREGCELGLIKEQNNGAHPITDTRQKHLLELMKKGAAIAKDLGLIRFEHAAHLSAIQFEHQTGIDLSSAIEKCNAASIALQHDLWTLKYVFISHDHGTLVEHPHLFGEKVLQAFPSAEIDIREAGNSIAVGNGTAAVFHLMRAVEVALVSLAYHFKIKRARHNKKYVPIQNQEWNQIISRIESKVRRKAESFLRGKKKDEFSAYYHGLLMEFRGFKDAFRNQVSHGRVAYSPSDAIAIKDRVERFLISLSEKVIQPASLDFD